MESRPEASEGPFAEHDPRDLGTARSVRFSILALSLCNLGDFLSSDVLEFLFYVSDSGESYLGTGG